MSIYAKLNDRAERIQSCLMRNKAPATVLGGTLGPGFAQFIVHPAPGTTVQKIRSLQADIGLAVGCSGVRIVEKNGMLAVEIPRARPRAVRLDALMAAQAETWPRYSMVLGLTETGATLAASLESSNTPHVLIAGATGSGKTTLARAVLQSLTLQHRPYELGVVVCDPKLNIERAFETSIARHLLAPVAHTADEQLNVLARVVKVMESRPITRDPAPRIVVYVDELADLCSSMMGGERAVGMLTRIAARGREAGVHLICCTQKPTSRDIGTLLKANLPLRLIGRVLSPEDARVAAGVAATGAERLSGSGDFLAVWGGQVTRFQAALPIDTPATEAQPAPARPGVILPEIEEVVTEAGTEEPDEGGKAGITDETVMAAVTILRARGAQVTKAGVHRILGQQQAGGAARMVNEAWTRLGL
jgi:DNA segregation ATPase FtsK/SpoIIIE, S-DNA-T family